MRRTGPSLALVAIAPGSSFAGAVSHPLGHALVQVSEALKVPLGQIQADVTLLAKGVRVVKTQLEIAEKAEPQPNDRFIKVMKPFYEYAQEVRAYMRLAAWTLARKVTGARRGRFAQRVDAINSRLERILGSFTKTVEGFGETPKSMDTEKLFTLLQGFLDDYEVGGVTAGPLPTALRIEPAVWSHCVLIPAASAK